jgi:protein-L-isoaspartate(D-aspartate) O-methyltransferase
MDVGAAATGWQAKRWHMVEAQLRRRGIRDERVLDAMAALPRELFVPPGREVSAYDDEPVSIGHGQTISQPFMTALMVQALELQGAETVLEVGAGCGYHAAVLASLARRVVALEIVPQLAADARRNLEAAGLAHKVVVITGDGSLGYEPFAPYDAISVAAAAPVTPSALLSQLADPGRMVIPVGDLDEQELIVFQKAEGKLTSRASARCRFVPLRGGGGWPLH